MPRTALILAAGPGIGAHCASAFRAAGYNTVTTSRSLKDNLKADDHLELFLDLAHPSSIPQLFQKIRQHFEHPSVVIYNGAARTLMPAEDPLSAVAFETVEHDIAVNVTSALVAAREAVLGWSKGEGGSSPTFIYTGNKLNVMADPKALTFGMAKTAAAKMMWDCAKAYGVKGFR